MPNDRHAPFGIPDPDQLQTVRIAADCPPTAGPRAQGGLAWLDFCVGGVFRMMIKLVVFIAVLIGISVFGMRGYRNTVRRFEAEQAQREKAAATASLTQPDQESNSTH